MRTPTSHLRSRRLLAATMLLALCAIPGHQADAGRRRGIVARKAPPLHANEWFGLAKGASTFDVSAHKGKVIYLFFFQSWCPGCHSRGFPALAAVADHYKGSADVVFATVQTVFEGFGINTAAAGLHDVQERGLDLPFGHDPGPKGKRSLTMGRYRSGGTPWTVIIGPDGVVRFDGFRISPKRAISLIERLR
jgi:thiol-disulfide isomerase/thioredoxin